MADEIHQRKVKLLVRECESDDTGAWQFLLNGFGGTLPLGPHGTVNPAVGVASLLQTEANFLFCTLIPPHLIQVPRSAQLSNLRDRALTRRISFVLRRIRQNLRLLLTSRSRYHDADLRCNPVLTKCTFSLTDYNGSHIVQISDLPAFDHKITT